MARPLRMIAALPSPAAWAAGAPVKERRVLGLLITMSVVFAWTGSDAVSGLADFALRVDGGAYQDVCLTDSATRSLSDGVHTIPVRATPGRAARPRRRSR